MEHLFEPFNRLGQAQLGEVGTGIGLVLCKRLVELMGGQIGIECAVGQGCDFWFELPLASDATLAPAQVQPAPTGVLEVALARRSLGYTVLHVDHNPTNLQLVEELLRWRPQHRLLAASHGALGIEFARAHLPDVILMDLNLPDICGTETMKILRADPLTAHIPVIALCANAMPHDIQDGLQVGFFSYVTKPIRVHEFLDALDDALHFSPRSSNDSSYQPPQSKAPE
jgi:CheY-like chemotaxis protein